ncbi:uncharacterized protein LOC119114722 [Pollicipes pollicipes]|uniref:uncharacterized protein LOC119114722 n=1 Tax=Pollicipes pollicipes TaxID=41117 RepID=UPI001885105D|nr:uncharacterized protein LOC119114722 [Pollicipes pollicipes]
MPNSCHVQAIAAANRDCRAAELGTLQRTARSARRSHWIHGRLRALQQEMVEGGRSLSEYLEAAKHLFRQRTANLEGVPEEVEDPALAAEEAEEERAPGAGLNEHPYERGDLPAAPEAAVEAAADEAAADEGPWQQPAPTCSICLEPWSPRVRRAAVMPCMHAFGCLACLRHVQAAADTGMAVCPFCPGPFVAEPVQLFL